jgi:hypothetical protein
MPRGTPEIPNSPQKSALKVCTENSLDTIEMRHPKIKIRHFMVDIKKQARQVNVSRKHFILQRVE